MRIKCQEQLKHLKHQIVHENRNCCEATFSYMHGIYREEDTTATKILVKRQLSLSPIYLLSAYFSLSA